MIVYKYCRLYTYIHISSTLQHKWGLGFITTCPHYFLSSITYGHKRPSLLRSFRLSIHIFLYYEATIKILFLCTCCVQLPLLYIQFWNSWKYLQKTFLSEIRPLTVYSPFNFLEDQGKFWSKFPSPGPVASLQLLEPGPSCNLLRINP